MARVRDLVAQADDQTKRPIVVKIEGGDKSFSFEDRKHIIIGRKDPTRDEVPDIDLTTLNLNFAGVSRKHCRFIYINSRWSIEDLGSRNGTWLNGKLLVANHPFRLRNNDQIRVGGISLTVELETEEQKLDEQTSAHKPVVFSNQLKFTSGAISKDQEGLNPSYITETVMPYLTALIDMAKHIDQAKKRPNREISIQSIQFNAPNVLVAINCKHEIFEFMTSQATTKVKADGTSSQSTASVPHQQVATELAKQFASENFPLIGPDQSTYYQKLLIPLLETCLKSNLKIVV